MKRYFVTVEAVDEDGKRIPNISRGEYVLSQGQTMELRASDFAVGVTIWNPFEETE